jgi:hypothetical protein
MFVRRLKSKNEKIYIQVVDKSSGKYIVKSNIGLSYDEKKIEELIIRVKIG